MDWGLQSETLSRTAIQSAEENEREKTMIQKESPSLCQHIFSSEAERYNTSVSPLL
jgi:hypothetical protein